MNRSTCFLLCTSILLVSGCASTPQPEKFHTILGAERWGFAGEGTTIESDIHVNGLHVRVVRRQQEQCSLGYSDHIELSGPIGPDSAFVVNQLLNDIEPCVDKDTDTLYATSIYLDSPGGYLIYGYNMGVVFRNHQVSTVIEKGQQCASSCAIAFTGGKFRHMHNEGELLFHAPYYKPNSRELICQDRDEARSLELYYQAMLGQRDGNRLFDRTMRQCSATDGWTVNADAASLYGLSDAIPPTGTYHDDYAVIELANEFYHFSSEDDEERQDFLNIAKEMLYKVRSQSEAYSLAASLGLMIEIELNENREQTQSNIDSLTRKLLKYGNTQQPSREEVEIAQQVLHYAAESGYPSALLHLGYLYKYFDLEDSKEQSKHWFEKSAAETSNAWAAAELAILRVDEEKYEDAYQLLSFSINTEQGKTIGFAYAWLGYLYENGFGTEKNAERALNNYYMAGELDNKWAIEKLVSYYEKQGDEQRSARWSNRLKSDSSS